MWNRIKGSRAGGCDGFLPSVCARYSRGPAPDEAGLLSTRTIVRGHLSATDEEFSIKHGSGGHTHVCGRGAGTVGSRRDAFSRIDYRARASLVRPVASCWVQTARVRSAVQLFWDWVHGLRDADQRADREAVYRAAPAGEKRSPGGGQRASAADRVLPGPGSAGADSFRAARRGTVVEPGV